MDKPTYVILLHFFFTALLLSAANNCSSQTPVYKNYTVNDGLPSQVVYCALQDRQGYMWFGTDAGASRFDGRRFENFTTADGLSDNEILNMFEDSKGRIWFLTLNGKLSYFFEDKIFNSQTDPKLEHIRAKFEFTSMMEDSTGNLWFSAIGRQIVVIKNDGTVQNYDFDSLDIHWRRAWIWTYELNKNEVWAFTPKHVFKFSNGNVSILDTSDFLNPFWNNFNLWHTTPSNAVYFSKDGICSLINGNHHVIFDEQNIPYYDRIQGICIDRKEDVWISTSNLKTLYLKRNPDGYSFKGEIFPGVHIGKIFIDMEGNSWFCTIGKGIFKIQSNSEYINLSKYPTINNEEITCIGKDNYGNICCGSSRGNIFFIRTDSFLKINLKTSDEMNCYVSNIAFDSLGDIYCATDHGLFLIKRDQSRYSIPKQIEIAYGNYHGSNFGTKNIKFDRSRQLYVSLISGLAKLSINRGNSRVFYLDSKEIPIKRIYCLYFDCSNTLWFENSEKLFSYDYKKLHSFPNLDNEFLSQITDIEGTSDSTLIISTYGSGIKFFKNGKIINRLNSSDGLAGDLCRRIFVDSNTIYVATNLGYSYFTYYNNKISDLKTFSTSDGINSNDIKDICAEGNKVYLATSSGLCIVDKKISQSKSPPPPLYVTSLHSSDSLYKNWDALKLKHNTDFSINYIAITFEQPEKIIYQYRLKNKSDTWIETKNTTINFSSLSSGTYIFELRAKKYNSDWSQPVSTQFKILPPFWLEWWFLLITGLLFISIIYYVVRFIASRKFRRQLELMRQQQMLSEERARISSDMHDDIGADLSNLLLLTRLTGRNSNLPVEEKVQLNRLELFTNGVIEKVDEIIWSLNPSNDSLKGLISFICDYFRNVVQLGTLKSFIEIPDDITDHSVSAVFRRNVFLVVKESLNNIVKHSGATMITLVVMIDGDHLQVSIKDNGSGFKRNPGDRRGNGLSNMQRRIEEIDGQFKLESETKEGTSIFISIPLH